MNMRVQVSYPKALHSGLTVEHDRCGGVWSEDVRSRSLPALVVVTVAGVVPKTSDTHDVDHLEAQGEKIRVILSVFVLCKTTNQ